LEDLAREEGADFVFHAAQAFRALGQAGRVRQVDLRRFLTRGILEGLRACAREKAKADRLAAEELEGGARAVAWAMAGNKYRWKESPLTVEERQALIWQAVEAMVAERVRTGPAELPRNRVRAAALADFVTGRWVPNVPNG
jgi:hypothetical protein